MPVRIYISELSSQMPTSTSDRPTLFRLSPATQNQQSQSSLPPVSYIKAIDVWMSSCTVFVFASLLQFGLVNYFMDAEPLSKDMTGYSVEDLTDLDEKKVRLSDPLLDPLFDVTVISFFSYVIREGECFDAITDTKANRSS